MKIRLACGTMMIGIALALTTPTGRVMAQANDAKAAAPKVSQTMTPHKHRYWRHRGGAHPHYGSRRLRNPGS